MCVIAVAKKNQKFNKEELRACFNYNPDGAGLMYLDKKVGQVHVKKGFFKFKDLWKEVTKLPLDTPRVVHMRIATSGAISTATCHPFPVCKNYKEMGLGDSYSNIALAHNGVMHEYTPTQGMKAKHSDTMQFIKEVIAPMGGSIFNEAVKEMTEKAMSPNRFAILGNKGQLAILGEWVQSEKSGILYSNSSYLTTPKYYYGGHNDDCCSYGNWDDYYDNTVSLEFSFTPEEYENVEHWLDDVYIELGNYGIWVDNYDLFENQVILWVDDFNLRRLPKTILGKYYSICEYNA